MADMQERIYANDANHWHPFPGEEGTVEYVRADIYAKELTALAIESKERELALAKLEAEVIAIRDRIQFLEKALDQAIEHGSFSIPTEGDFVDIPSHVKWYTPGAVMTGDEITRYVVLPELAQYLKEKKEQ